MPENIINNVKYNDFHYGKGMVKVAKVIKKADGVDDFKEFIVDIQLYGKLLIDSFRQPSNALVVPTDTMKNTVYVLAKKYPMNNPVEFGIDITNHFIQKYAHITKVHVEIHEAVWRRILISDGSEHTHGFVDKSSYRNKCSIINDGVNLSVEAGIEGIEILKTRGSAFENYWVDEYTTLQPARDRIMSTKANITWTYDSFYDVRSINHGEVFSSVKQMFTELFAKHDESFSVQHSIDVIGNHILSAIQELKTIDFNLPNVHYLLFNLEQFKMENNNEVFTPTSEPYGNIFAKLSKTDHAIKLFNEVSEEKALGVLKDIIYSDKACKDIMSKRPFKDIESFRDRTNKAFLGLINQDYEEIVSKHTRLGNNLKKLRYIHEEFSQLDLLSFEEIDKLNQAYEEKFKHVFIISVTGKSIEEILCAFQSRIENDHVTEFNICVEEVKKIINVRIFTVLNSFAKSVVAID
jgi:urate oxidase